MALTSTVHACVDSFTIVYDAWCILMLLSGPCPDPQQHSLHRRIVDTIYQSFKSIFATIISLKRQKQGQIVNIFKFLWPLCLLPCAKIAKSYCRGCDQSLFCCITPPPDILLFSNYLVRITSKTNLDLVTHDRSCITTLYKTCGHII